MARRTLNINRIRLRHTRKVIAFERKYAKVIYSALERTIEPILEDYERKLDSSIIFNAIVPIYEEVGTSFANEQYNLLESLIKKADGFFLTTWRTWMRIYAEKRLTTMIVDITQTTRDKINAVVAEGVEKGLSRTEISKNIQEKTLGEIGKRRARTIAKTEVNTAANEGKERSANDWAKESGNNLYKIWVHSASPNERSWHKDLDDGKAIPKEQPYRVYNPTSGGTENMMKPCAEGASAGNVIQCNCTIVYVSERYAKRMNSRIKN